MTGGILVHMNPKILQSVMTKMYDMSNKYIFGFEYYSDELIEVNYRGHESQLWKQNFPLLWKKTIPSLELVKEQKYYYKNEDLVDVCYLLQK